MFDWLCSLKTGRKEYKEFYPFDIERARKGDEVVFRDGTPTIISRISEILSPDYKPFVQIDFENGSKNFPYHLDGFLLPFPSRKCYHDRDLLMKHPPKEKPMTETTEHENDLFMDQKKVKKWFCVYQCIRKNLPDEYKYLNKDKTYISGLYNSKNEFLLDIESARFTYVFTFLKIIKEYEVEFEE